MITDVHIILIWLRKQRTDREGAAMLMLILSFFGVPS